MKQLLAVLLTFSIYGCSSIHTNGIPQQCKGNSQPPEELANSLEAVEDAELLELALGGPDQGKLCQGQVYMSKEGSHVTLYRAWNSTNPNSQMGQWWAFNEPAGKVSQYRTDYEICYQWSPLDKLTRCSLKPGVNIVIGTGQSAECSKYLTYPVSAKKQIYLDDASAFVSDCTTYDNEFSWK